jgi:hypothetical protein
MTIKFPWLNTGQEPVPWHVIYTLSYQLLSHPKHLPIEGEYTCFIWQQDVYCIDGVLVNSGYFKIEIAIYSNCFCSHIQQLVQTGWIVVPVKQNGMYSHIECTDSEQIYFIHSKLLFLQPL